MNVKICTVTFLANEPTTLVRSLEARLTTLKAELRERNEQVEKLSYSNAEFKSSGHYAYESMEALSQDLRDESSIALITQ